MVTHYCRVKHIGWRKVFNIFEAMTEGCIVEIVKKSR